MSNRYSKSNKNTEKLTLFFVFFDKVIISATFSADKINNVCKIKYIEIEYRLR